MRDDCWDDWDDTLVLLLGLLVTVLYTSYEQKNLMLQCTNQIKELLDK